MNLVDVLKYKDAPIVGVVEDYAKTANLISNLDVLEVPGTSFEAPYITSDNPGTFRGYGVGVAMPTGGISTQALSLKYMDFSINEDVQIAEAATIGVEAHLALQLERKIKGTLRALEAQILHGTANIAAGFSGIDNIVTGATNVFSKGGTGSALSKVYAINKDQIKLLLGKGGEVRLGEIERRTITDTSGNPYDVYHLDGGAWLGAYIVGTQACKILERVGTTLTDNDFSTLIDAFAQGFTPDLFVASQRSISALRNSRTATNPTGAPAPYATEVFGIPLISANVKNDFSAA